MPDPGLQALILCGPGSSFTTFMTNPDENPKALLPIANRPMVWYPIDFCHRMGITGAYFDRGYNAKAGNLMTPDITLICPPSSAKAITAALNINPYLTNLPAPRPVLLAPEDLDQNASTAEILRLPEVRKLVTRDFVVLPCDLVCELSGEKLLQAWMIEAASLSDVLDDASWPAKKGGSHGHSGGMGIWYETKTATPIKGEETDFIVTAPLPPASIPPPRDSILPDVSLLLLSMPTDSLNDLKEEKKGLPIRYGMLNKHARIRMRMTHRDAHVYIFPKWVMKCVEENEKLESIGEDVIGWWAKATWQRGLAEKLSVDKVFEHEFAPKKDDESGPDDSMLPQDEDAEELLRRPPSADMTQQSSALRKLQPRISGDTTAAAPTEQATTRMPPFLAYIHPSKPDGSGPIVRRVDTAPLLLAVSLQLAKLPSLEEAGPDASPFAHARKVAYPEGVKPRTTITRADSLVAENVTVDEKTSIKESVVGAGCQLAEGTKLLQCLLMEGVVVGKNCKLTRCILGKRCVIGEGSVLTDCEVQENLLVEPRSKCSPGHTSSTLSMICAERHSRFAAGIPTLCCKGPAMDSS